MRLLARSYYEGKPDVEWKETDDGKFLVGEVCGGADFGDLTVETLTEKQLIESIRNSVPHPSKDLYVADEKLVKKLRKAGIPCKKVESELDMP